MKIVKRFNGTQIYADKCGLTEYNGHPDGIITSRVFHWTGWVGRYAAIEAAFLHIHIQGFQLLSEALHAQELFCVSALL